MYYFFYYFIIIIYYLFFILFLPAFWKFLIGHPPWLEYDLSQYGCYIPLLILEYFVAFAAVKVAIAVIAAADLHSLPYYQYQCN